MPFFAFDPKRRRPEPGLARAGEDMLFVALRINCDEVDIDKTEIVDAPGDSGHGQARIEGGVGWKMLGQGFGISRIAG
jgi:hypothetical protein